MLLVPSSERSAYRLGQIFCSDRLCQEIRRAHLHGLNSGTHSSKGCHKNDRAFQAIFFKLTEKADAIAVRELEFANDGCNLTVGNHRESSL